MLAMFIASKAIALSRRRPAAAYPGRRSRIFSGQQSADPSSADILGVHQEHRVIITFNAIGSPRNPAWFVLQRLLISLISVVVYALLLHSGIGAHYALLGFVVAVLLVMKLRRFSEPQHLNARHHGEDKVTLSGHFAEGRISVLKRQTLVSVETSAERLLLHCLDEATPRQYSIDLTSYRQESLQAISALLTAVVEGRKDIDTLPEAGQARIHRHRDHLIVNLHQKPSYLLLTWVSLVAALVVLYVGVRLILQ
jgi:hypothetical protein